MEDSILKHLPPKPAENVDSAIPELQDVSMRVQELMRKIDRLPPGTYELTITKGEIRAMPWDVNISRLERIETLRLSKYLPK